MTDPLVSVVIAAYNAAPFLRETLESVVAQTYGNFEILVIDDGCGRHHIRLPRGSGALGLGTLDLELRADQYRIGQDRNADPVAFLDLRQMLALGVDQVV